MKKEELKELLKKCFGKEKDEQLNAIVMLTIMMIFIVILVIIVRVGTDKEKSNLTNNPTQTPVPTENVIKPIEDTEKDLLNEEGKQTGNYEINYSYLYTFTLNGKQEIITGKKLDNKEIFTIVNEDGSKDYAKLSNNYLIKNKNSYNLTTVPSTNLQYASIDDLAEILGLYTPNIEQNQYTYYISNKDLISIYKPELENTQMEEKYNPVTLTINNDRIEKMVMDYSNLYEVINKTPGTYLISLEFNNIGTTEDFTIRIDWQ